MKIDDEWRKLIDVSSVISKGLILQEWFYNCSLWRTCKSPACLRGALYCKWGKGFSGEKMNCTPPPPRDPGDAGNVSPRVIQPHRISPSFPQLSEDRTQGKFKWSVGADTMELKWYFYLSTKKNGTAQCENKKHLNMLLEKSDPFT